MAKKVSEYTTAATVFASGDLFDLTKLVSTGPDVYESQKANANLLAGWNLFGQDQTMPAPRLHNLSNNQLSLTNGRLLLKGSDNIGTDLLKLESLAGTEVFKALNNGTIKISNAFTLPVADGTAGQALLTDGAGAVSFGNVAGIGVFGISDLNGVYTYYTTIELALSAASNGDTIEQFADVSVSTSTSITLDKSITWNMNGYEYKNTSTSSFIMLNLPNNTTIDLTINNGQFVRNTGSSNGGTLFYMGNKILTKINSNGVIYNNVEGQCVDGKADITGGTFKSTAPSILGFYFQGIAHNIKVYSVRTNQLLNTGCRIYNSYFYASVDYTILTGGAICYNTIFESPASYGVRLGTGTTTELNNCVAKGLFGAIFMQGGSIYNCTGISTGGFGIEMGNANARAFNSVGISPATNGFSISGLAEAYNCTALATSGYAVIMQNDGKFKNGTAKTTFNNANGHGIFITGVPVSGGFEVVGCEIITTNASANAIDGASGAQGKYAQNSFKGMTTSIGLVTSNLATNTADAQGNLLL